MKIVSPAPLTFVKGGVASVRVTTAASVKALVARVGRVDVSRAFTRTGKGVWTASLTRAAHQLAVGPNTLTVRAAVKGAPTSKVIFLVGSHDPALVAFRSVPARAGTPLAFTIAAPRSDYRAFQVVLNGHDITADFVGQTTGRMSTRIGADDGLRTGVNRIRVYVETNENRFLDITKAFTIADGPLAAAGSDRSVRVGQPMRLGGSALTADRTGHLTYSWTPSPTSAMKLTNPTSAHPTLVVRTPGRYTVTVKVTQHGGRRDGAVSTDTIAVASSPNLPPVGTPVSLGTSITANGVTYSLSPGDSLLAVVLDQVTLQPIGLTQNSWSAAEAPTLLGELQSATSTSQSNAGHVIVLLSNPPGMALPNAFDQVVTEAGGASPNGKRGFSLVGYPLSPAASVEYQPSATGPLSTVTGYLQADPDAFFRFVADSYPTFTTSSSLLPTSNTMTIGGKAYSATLPACASGGYQVEEISAATGAAITGATFETAGCAGADVTGVTQMSAALQEAILQFALVGGPPLLVFVQSIGNPRQGSGAPATAWVTLANQIQSVGGTAQGFFAGSGASTTDTSHSYALAGSVPSLGSGRGSESVSALTGNPGVLSGALHRGRSWNYETGYTQMPGISLTGLPQIATEPLQSWPLSANVPNLTGGGFYLNAQNYIAAQLERKLNLTPGFTGCGGALPGIRAYYCTVGFVTGTDAQRALGALNQLSYVPTSAFTSADFGVVQTQLQTELGDIMSIQQDFEEFGSVYDASNSKSANTVEAIANNILNTLGGKGTFDGNPLSIAATLVQGLGTAESLAAAATGIGTALFLVADIGTEIDGKTPLVNEIQTDASNIGSSLQTYFESVNAALTTEQYVIDTDWGKLKNAVAELAPALSTLTGTGKADLTASVTASVSSWATGELLPSVYKLVILNAGELNPNPSADPTTYRCSIQPPVGPSTPYTPFSHYTSTYPGWFTVPVSPSGAATGVSRPVLLVSVNDLTPRDGTFSDRTPAQLPKFIPTFFQNTVDGGYGQVNPSYLISTFGTSYSPISC
ncbi:MAG TPA: PKD domain-containing protein [Frankiaceae bacterium]|nr:PKD domain-containing protein [Frankiaceae bacterium]